MTKDKALRLAFEALHYCEALNSSVEKQKMQAITAIKAALEAKDEPVPVAIVEVFGKDWRLDYMALPVGKHKLYAQQYTYTTPSQRKPLTDEEIEDFAANTLCVYSFARAIETKLKDKNT